MPELRIHLDEITHQLERRDLELHRRLRPGLGAQRIDELLRPYPHHLPQEIHLLYEWRNGSPRRLELIPGVYQLPLEKAVKLYRSQIALGRRIAGEDWAEVWDPRWFPVFALRDKEWLIVIGTDETVDRGPLYRLLLEDGEPVASYESLTAMMAETADAYRSGAYLADALGRVKEDEDRAAAVRRRHAREQVEAVVEALSDDPSAEELRSLQGEVLRFKEPRTVPLLVSLLADGGLEQQKQAAVLLGRMGDGRAVEPLLEALGRVHPTVQGNVAAALGQLGDRRAAGRVLELARNGRNLEARIAAVAALRRLATPEVLHELGAMLRERPPIALRIQIQRVLSDRRVGNYKPFVLRDFQGDPELLAQARQEAEAEPDPFHRHARLQAVELELRYGDRPPLWLVLKSLVRSLMALLFRR